MSLPKSTARKRLIKRFRALGFDGPRSGAKHQFMVKGELKIRIPNPHEGDVTINLLKMILRQANITEDEWNSALD